MQKKVHALQSFDRKTEFQISTETLGNFNLHDNCLGPEELVAPLTSSPLLEVFPGDCEHLAGAAQCFLGSSPGFGDLRGAAVWVRFPGLG